MTIALVALSLLAASAACGLSLAVALRVKKLLDPLTEEGALSNRRGDVPRAGTVVPQVTGLVDTEGREVRLPVDDTGPWLLSFQSVGCSGCEQQLPAYKKFLRDGGFDKDRVISIVVGEADGVPFYRDELGDLARVVADQEQALTLLGELGVTMFPTYLIVDPDGRVAIAAGSSSRLAEHRATLSAAAPVGG